MITFLLIIACVFLSVPILTMLVCLLWPRFGAELGREDLGEWDNPKAGKRIERTPNFLAGYRSFDPRKPFDSPAASDDSQVYLGWEQARLDYQEKMREQAD